MSTGGFLFPRTIAITRPLTSAPAAGAGDFADLVQGDETPVLSGIPARIELWRIGARPVEHLPGDTPTQPLWKILISWSTSIAPGTILFRDVVTDDGGMRYQVISAEFESSLGWRLVGQQLAT